MKLLFVHSTKLIEDDEGNLYTGGSFNSQVWQRYLNLTEKFTVIARKSPVKVKKKEAEEKYNYFDSKKIKFLQVPNLTASIKSIFNIGERVQADSIIEQEVLNSDCIIARLPSKYGYIAIKYAKKHNKRYLIEAVGCAWDEYWSHSLKGKLFAYSNYLNMKKSIRNAPYVIYVTNQFLQKRYPTAGKWVACSNVMLDEFNDKVIADRLERIKELSLDKKVIVGTIGAVDVKYKGHEYVIKAIAKIQKENQQNIEYQIVGGGNAKRLKDLSNKYGVSSSVRFLGAMNHFDVIKWLETIDIYIQPSKTEGLPRALIEAMSKGLLSIGSNVGGIPELLESPYIFRHGVTATNKLSRIILNIGKNNMNQQAERNYKESKKYDKKIIERRRNEFLREFIRS